MNKDIQTKELTPEQVSAVTKSELTKYGLEPMSKVTVTDPLTGQSREITIDRTGHGENKLIMALADPNLKRDQKDHMLSMYLWERGKESSSFIVDIMRYKGEHTKETRAFKSQMRFDFELFVSQFSKFIREQSKLIGIMLGVDIIKERDEFLVWLRQQREKEKTDKLEFKDLTYLDYIVFKGVSTNKVTNALMGMAIQSLEEGERIVSQIQNVTKARERDAGKGIYIDTKGRPYTFDDPDMDEAIKLDRERRDELNQE